MRGALRQPVNRLTPKRRLTTRRLTAAVDKREQPLCGNNSNSVLWSPRPALLVLRFWNMELAESLPSLAKARENDKAAFIKKLQGAVAYRWFRAICRYDPSRLSNLTETCWRFHCASLRNDL